MVMARKPVHGTIVCNVCVRLYHIDLKVNRLRHSEKQNDTIVVRLKVLQSPHEYETSDMV